MKHQPVREGQTTTISPSPAKSECTALSYGALCVKSAYIVVSHKDWEPPNSKILVARIEFSSSFANMLTARTNRLPAFSAFT